jgi:hypothetical protein
MGCFSFKCKECDQGIISNSINGEEVRLYLLEDGEVIQAMFGQYDSYGRVFTADLQDSIYWHKDWGDVCELIFDGGHGDGIAAVHAKCWTGKIPTTASEDDPNQGCPLDNEFDYGDGEH